MNISKNQRRFIYLTAISLLVIFISLGMLPGHIATVGSQTSFSVEYNTDRGGGDYKNFDIPQANHEVCRDYCAADAVCKAYTYTKPFQNDAAHCWLKKSVPNPVPYRDCCTSGVKGGSSSGGDQTNFSLELDTDRGGTDYRNFDMTQANHEVCRNACAADTNCKAYTYFKPYQNYAPHCWLKSGVPNPVPYRTCCISGVKGGKTGGGGGGETNVADFTGQWDAGIDGFSFNMVLKQQGTRVTGTLDGPNGTIQGDVVGKSFRFRFTYNGNKGAGTCVLSDDGKSYKGFFGNSDNPDDRSRGYWNGTKR